MNGRCYDFLMRGFEKVALREARRTTLSSLKGRILEVGCGTGVNFEWYRDPSMVTAIDPDKDMLKVARSVCPAGLRVEPWGLEDIPLEGYSFDHIVCTLVLCSVRDPGEAFETMKRLLKPGGTIHLLEHIKGVGLPGQLHELCTPLWSKVAGGCHLNRNTLGLLEESGFHITESSTVLTFIGTPFVMATARLPQG